MSIFDEIANGSIDIDDSDELMTEAVTSDSIKYMKMVQKQIMLPQGSPIGKGNVAFLYTNNLDESINIINSTENCLAKRHYRYYYFNLLYQGKIYNKKFRYRIK